MSMVYCDFMEAYQDVQDRNMAFIERFMMVIPINLSSMSMVYCDIMEAYQDVQDRNMAFIERFMMVMTETWPSLKDLWWLWVQCCRGTSRIILLIICSSKTRSNLKLPGQKPKDKRTGETMHYDNHQQWPHTDIIVKMD